MVWITINYDEKKNTALLEYLPFLIFGQNISITASSSSVHAIIQTQWAPTPTLSIK